MSTPTATVFQGSQCPNKYVCPGQGNGYAISFNITDGDVGSIIDSTTGITIENSTSQNGLTYWWDNKVRGYPGVAGTSKTCIRNLGYADALCQAIVAPFGISRDRACGATLTPLRNADQSIALIKFQFFISDASPTNNQRNDYLSANCAGIWISSWLNHTNSLMFANTDGTTDIASTYAVPTTIPAILAPNCAAPGPSISKFTGSVINNIEENNDVEKIKESLKDSFNPTSKIFALLNTNIEHLTGLSTGATQLNGVNTSTTVSPTTIVDWVFAYSYLFSFIGAILFTIIQIVDVNIPSMYFNKNVIIAINVMFILWSTMATIHFFNKNISDIPLVGRLLNNFFEMDIPYVLPFHTNSMVVGIKFDNPQL